MELDELKGAWQALERKLDRQHALDLHQFRAGRLSTMRARLRPLLAGQFVQLLTGVVLVMLVAPYWIQRWGEWHVVVYGASLHAYGLMLAIFAGRDIAHLLRIDYAAPVLEIQKQLAELRAMRMRAGPAFAIAGCFVWVPGVLIIFHALGADVWRNAPSVVYWFLASSLVALAVTIGFIRWSRSSARVARHVEDSSVGRSLARAQAVLDEIARFENA